jgi:hypothetical protein
LRFGDPALGTNGHFNLLIGPMMNTPGDVAFLATTDTGSTTPVLGLWIHSGAGLRAVALPGQPVQGQPDAPLIQSVQVIDSFNDGGFVLFTAELTSAGGLGSDALLMADPAGEIAVLARTGGTIAVGPGDVRTVGQIIVRGGALSDDAHAAFGVAFTNGSGAEFLGALTGAACYANCDGSTTAPVLNVNDFICFQAAFAAGASYANCDGSTTLPVLNVNDFICFQAKFAAGCP